MKIRQNPSALEIVSRGIVPNPVHPHGPGDVLDLLIAQILKPKGQSVADVVIDCIRNEYPTRLRQRLQPRRDIHPVAENVLLLNDHVAQIDTDTEPDAPLLRYLGLAVSPVSRHALWRNPLPGLNAKSA
jgi:hypothetical protein